MITLAKNRENVFIMKCNKIGFIGLGLIGGSIAKRLKSIHKDLTIIASSGHLSTIEAAYAEGLIANNYLCKISDFYDCDYIFLCTPVQQNLEYLRQLKGNISEHCIITDVGSVKSDIHHEIISLGMEKQFIGGHPMAGSEKTGLANSKDALLENAYYIITPTAQTSDAALFNFKKLVSSLGAIPLVLDYEIHDYATAAISHLPHIIAYNLVNLVQEADDTNETMKTIAAGGFKDITRIASSSPVMWENICLSNRKQLLKLIDAFIGKMQETHTAITNADSDALIHAFSAAKDYRDSITINHNGALKQVYEIYIDLLDEAGGIATIATILATNNLSIKNIGIIHNREFEDGVLRLEMYDRESLDTSITLLKRHHYTIYER